MQVAGIILNQGSVAAHSATRVAVEMQQGESYDSAWTTVFETDVGLARSTYRAQPKAQAQPVVQQAVAMAQAMPMAQAVPVPTVQAQPKQ